MSWNYRVIKTRASEEELNLIDGEFLFSMRDVYYYTDNKTIKLIGAVPVNLDNFEDAEDLTQALEWFDDALHKPIIEYDELNKTWKEE